VTNRSDAHFCQPLFKKSSVPRGRPIGAIGEETRRRIIEQPGVASPKSAPPRPPSGRSR
jgi:hypothetical protein